MTSLFKVVPNPKQPKYPLTDKWINYGTFILWNKITEVLCVCVCNIL